VWATGEAASSFGFAGARLFDEMDPLERTKTELLASKGVKGGRAEFKALRAVEKDVLEFIALDAKPESEGDKARYEALKSDTLVQFVLLDSLANVVCPAVKLWNTGYGANVLREAVSLMGGYGITEDCPGFLGQKWMDAQLEATYEGPEAVQRRQLSVTMIHPVFLAQFKGWIGQMRRIASDRPGTGACALASAMEIWLWTVHHLQTGKDADGAPLYQGARQGVTFPLADALCWLLAARYQILDVLELERRGPENPMVAEGLLGLLNFFSDLCHVQSARAAGEVGRICAELVHGYNRHPAWDEVGCASCFTTEDLETLENVMPGMASYARSQGDVIEGGVHPFKAGPCVRFEGLEQFQRMRMKMDGCLTGARLAKDRAAQALTKVMIPEALDYPQ
ncbi:MAG: acyl-CoA dehydrogenase family protein, partial [bacterium]